MTFAGIGQPGQRETTRAGLETGYSLVVRQVKMMVLWGWAIIALLLLGVFAFWASADLRGWLRWVMAEWKWLLGPFILWGVSALSLGIWRFAAEVADPTYPTPRSPVPEIQRDGPRWPWTPEPLMYEDDEPAQAKRRIEIVLKSHNGRTVQYADLPELPGLATFAKLVVGGESFAYRTANRCGISDGQFDDLASLFRSKRRPEWARWRNPDNKKLGTELLPAGEAVMERLAQDSPTLLEAV